MKSFKFLFISVVIAAFLLRLWHHLLLLNSLSSSILMFFSDDHDISADYSSSLWPLVHLHRNETSEPLTAETEDVGCIYGTFDDTFPNTRLFLGVPFARPPVGALRFSKPVPLQSTMKHGNKSMCLQADRYSPVCPQVEFYLRQSEDCLYLNIYAPSKERLMKRRKFQSSVLPVLIYFYGGAFVLGSGGEHKVYDASHIVEHNDLIVVTFNYRVGPLGFLGGNWGIYDQQLAIEWVRRNIGGFGGDSRNLILWGQSAGALSALVHLTNTGRNGSLSHTGVTKAILQSAPVGLLFKSAPEADRIQSKFLQKNHCSNIDCLKRKSVVDIMTTRIDEVPWKPGKPLSDILHWFPMIDGEIIQGQLMDSIAFVKQNITIMMGTTEDELSIIPWLLERTKAVGSGVISQILKKNSELIFGSRANPLWDIMKHLKSNPRIPIRFDTVFDILSQKVFDCPNQKLSKLLYDNNNQVNLYKFQFKPNYLDSIGGVCAQNRICHAVDIPYFFHIYSQFITFTKRERNLADMIDFFMFKRFAVDIPLTNSTYHDKEGRAHDVQDWLDYPGMMKINDDWVLTHVFDTNSDRLECEFIETLM